MSLERYSKKRDFSRTPEPRGGGKKKPAGRIFVVQKHDASRLHYDFRLQVDGALASWAVPKGPSLDPTQKRLAVHVEDHPLGYADFEGVIPAGEYGGGTVLVWDKGTWTPEEKDPARAIQRGKLSFQLHGTKLHGGWTLTRLRARSDDNGEDQGDNWLLIKHDDEEAIPGGGSVILEELPDSVKTGRSLEEISEEEGGPAPRGSRRARAGAGGGKSGARGGAAPGAAGADPVIDPEKITGARRARMPRKISPQLCTLVESAPEGDDWLHEIKFDGYRLLGRVQSGRATLITRAGHDWTGRFPPLAGALERLPVRQAVVDGEATILDASGHPSFQRLQNAIKAADFDDLVFYAFDLLYVDGYDLRASPLIERKEALRRLVPSTEEGVLRYSDHVRGGGPLVRENACELALEGIVSKQVSAPYTQTRSRTWLKVKCTRRQEFVIIGWSPPEGARKHFGSLLLGAHDGEGRLVYTGRVGTGFTAASLKDIKQRLDGLGRRSCPADDPPTREERRGVRWVEPELVAEVEFAEWTDDGRLRHASFQGLREDKEAADVRIERPNPAPEREPPSAALSVTRRAGASAPPRRVRPKGAEGPPLVRGVAISNADRVLYPDQGETKLDVALYYEAVAERMLPHVAGRPLSTVRCPRGRAQKCFFQKHLGDTLGPPVKAIEVREKSGSEPYISIDSAEGLIALVQFGVLEIHPWGSRAEDLEHPDLITFDLDPGEGVEFERVKQAARRVRDELARAGLVSFLKTTGGKGLHVVAPLRPRAGWDEAKAFCEALAKRLASEEPESYVATLAKAKRTGKIFIDYLRNGRGSTSIAPYSTRARAGAPVAMPLRWEELGALDAPDKHNIRSAVQRLARLKRDPWEGFFGTAQSLP
ncbi:MAG TPA: DNA ligase D [Phycisphaerales bacterium]|nr:DNA ligase D [Phycisphaerales bacterium]